MFWIAGIEEANDEFKYIERKFVNNSKILVGDTTDWSVEKIDASELIKAVMDRKVRVSGMSLHGKKMFTVLERYNTLRDFMTADFVYLHSRDGENWYILNAVYRESYTYRASHFDIHVRTLKFMIGKGLKVVGLDSTTLDYEPEYKTVIAKTTLLLGNEGARIKDGKLYFLDVTDIPDIVLSHYCSELMPVCLSCDSLSKSSQKAKIIIDDNIKVPSTAILYDNLWYADITLDIDRCSEENVRKWKNLAMSEYDSIK